jgi:hypothetical protein
MKKIFQNIQVLTSLYGLLMTGIVSAGVYYVGGNSASDNNTGAMNAPFATISKAAGLMQGGDTCYIRAGTYYEEIRPDNSGSSGNPIVFSGVPGEETVVHGGRMVSGWTVHSGNVYKASVDGSVKEVFMDRRNLLWARHPNMPYDPEEGFDMNRPELGTANPPSNVDWSGVNYIRDNGSVWVNNISQQDSYTNSEDGVLLGVLGQELCICGRRVALTLMIYT